MRALHSLFAASIAVLMIGVGCGDDTDGAGVVTDGGSGGGPARGTAGNGGSGGSTPDDRDAAVKDDHDAGATDHDAGGPTACELKDQALETFVAANRSCNVDSDCQMIGDCGGNIDWRAVNVSAAEQGYALMNARCYPNGADGPLYVARCQSGVCVSEESGVCGAPPPDAGLDAGLDAGAGDAGDGG